MEGRIHRDILQQLPVGYALRRLVLNEAGEPEDYIYLEVNAVFEEIVGVRAQDIVGRRATEVISGIRDEDFDWVRTYGEAVLAGKKLITEMYLRPRKRWFKVISAPVSDLDFAAILVDITAEKEKFLEMDKLFDSIHDAVFIVDHKDGQFRYRRTNVAHQNLTGFSPAAIVGKTPVELAGEEIGGRITANYRAVAERAAPITYEETIALPGGERTWITTLNPVVMDGEVKQIVGSSKDITEQKRAEREKQILYRRLHAMFNQHNAVMLVIEATTGKIIDANPAACAFYGYSREEILKKSIQDINLLPGEEVDKLRLAASQEKKEYIVVPHRLASGETRLVDVYCCPLDDPQGKLLFSIIFDVTEREKVKAMLQREKELLRTTLYSIGDGVVTTDNQGLITSMNRAAEEVTGWREEEVIGVDFAQIFKLHSEETGEVVENPVEKVLAEGKSVGLANHTVLITRDGKKIPIADSAAPVKDRDGRLHGTVMVFRDITEERKQRNEILFLSYHDPLTGLYNRRYTEEKLRQLDKSDNLPISVIMGDLNGLKLTNDVFGHEVGDQLLKKAAQVLKDNCRKEDIIARWGGDEFVILLPGTNEKGAGHVIQRIKNECKKVTGLPVNISIALGQATKQKKQESLWQVLKTAEERMYRHKFLNSKSNRNALIVTLQKVLYEISMETEQHAERLKKYCLAMGKAMDLTHRELDELALLAVLHDIGKVGISMEILNKDGPLTEEEWVEMKRHPEIGCRIAQNTLELVNVADYILSHHERWDGRGYPRGLRGKEIPLLARILAVADAYDAMTTDRVYRKALSREKAWRELKKNAGSQFDPEVVKVFLELFGEEQKEAFG